MHWLFSGSGRPGTGGGSAERSPLASLYRFTQAGALLFPGTALVHPGFAGPGKWPAQLVVDVVMLALLAIAVVVERRVLRRDAA